MVRAELVSPAHATQLESLEPGTRRSVVYSDIINNNEVVLAVGREHGMAPRVPATQSIQTELEDLAPQIRVFTNATPDRLRTDL
jgi:hypothetical protein